MLGQAFLLAWRRLSTASVRLSSDGLPVGVHLRSARRVRTGGPPAYTARRCPTEALPMLRANIPLVLAVSLWLAGPAPAAADITLSATDLAGKPVASIVDGNTVR